MARESDTFKTDLLLGILSLAGVALVLLSTARYGVGLSPDSVKYIAAARSLLSGEGYMQYDSTPFVRWPPLFPALLALPGLVGFTPLAAARFLNAFAFGLVIFTSGKLFLMHVRSKALALLGAAAVLLSPPLYFVSLWAWSEPLYTLFVVLFVICLSKYMCEGRGLLFLLTVAFAALSCLQRYAGVVTIQTGFLALLALAPERPFRGRLRQACAFSLLAATPLLLWLLRNQRLTSTLAGHRGLSRYGLFDNISQTFDVLTAWFAAPTVPLSLRVAGLALLALALVASEVLLPSRGASRSPFERSLVTSAAVFVGLYAAFLLTAASMVAFDRINDRLLAPIFVFVVFLLLILIEHTYRGLGSLLKNQRLAKLIVVGSCLLWLSYPLLAVYERALDATKNGVGGFNQALWRDSRLIDWVRGHPLDGKVFSNAPDALYVQAGLSARGVPHDSRAMKRLRKSMSPKDTYYLLWFDHVPLSRDYFESLIASHFDVERVEAFPDGGVFILKRGGGRL